MHVKGSGERYHTADTAAADENDKIFIVVIMILILINIHFLLLSSLSLVPLSHKINIIKIIFINAITNIIIFIIFTYT